MNQAENFLKNKLNDRIEKALLRKLTNASLPFDFCSNDYLGFARSLELKSLIEEQSKEIEGLKNGSGGSRLLSGNHPYTEETEQFIANFHHSETGLIFNSGYDANVGLLSSIPQRGDTIITDELIHASLIDGARLSNAERFKFKHNDLVDLEQKLKNAKGLIYVVVESVYSMDGDLAPLQEISKLCKLYNTHLIVDEAHATGIFGEHGKGLVVELNLENDIFARIVTFGKAIGTHGAIILGSENLRNYLINFARSFIYTTGAPLHNILAVNCAYQLLAKGDETNQITKKINLYNQLINDLNLSIIPSQSAIQTVLFNSNESARKASASLQNKGFEVKAILSPTVAEGKERLRICLHTYNSDEEIINLVNHLKTFQ
ncbi:aminotransferase class I/II-fold pyridoxal phosphate-dependent enzyme [Pedobacter sp. LMG 31464]|uniref:Aminotransferase class I/II-fold pyridoxal phosphate-dependent enzyme n=1 Tax=Pedobacter planticolens TaxID=2679964 RepID=A0A923DZD0_9SPHI|nr:pyridoxal phosphate-dependent aminotransferase family protein [Pedobacter planticolens]MBB2144759.1 aminotransferase class I/II-fold pyridoxal phosphate-dependent enzyme [Pedobacter planticolens]